MHPVRALFRRNAWATERLLDFCQGRPETAADAEADVFGGIEPTFNHLLGAETGYLRLLTGELPEDRVEESRPRSVGDLREPGRWLAGCWAAALDGDRDPELVRPDQRGDDPELMPDWIPLVQSVHHGDDHRTQIATLLTRHGVEPPWLDGWAFAEEGAGEVAVGAAAKDWWAALLRRCFGHHLWATERLLETCRELSPEQLALSAPGTTGRSTRRSTTSSQRIARTFRACGVVGCNRRSRPAGPGRCSSTWRHSARVGSPTWTRGRTSTR